jgi:hypothetical protein
MATSAGTAATATNATALTALGHFDAYYSEDSWYSWTLTNNVTLSGWDFNFGQNAIAWLLGGERTWWLRDYGGITMYLTNSSFHYVFGTGGNVLTNNHASASLSGTTTLTNLTVNGAITQTVAAATNYFAGSVGIGANLEVSGTAQVYTASGRTLLTIKSGAGQGNNRIMSVEDASGNMLFEFVDLGGGMQFGDSTRGAGIFGGALSLGSERKLNWSSTTTLAGTPDTSLSRQNSGTIGVTTNLAVSGAIYWQTNSTVVAPVAGFGGIYIDATTNYWFWHPNAGGAGPGWTNKLW